MTWNSFITLKNTWRKENTVCVNVRVGVVELWSHHRAACPTGLRSAKGKFTREEVLYTWLTADSVGGATRLKNSPLLS